MFYWKKGSKWNSDFFSRTILVDIFVHFEQKAFKVNRFQSFMSLDFRLSRIKGMPHYLDVLFY